MTDRQIVVDGIDISGCEHVYARTSLFEEKNFVECTAFFLENEDSRCNCSDNPNCYYKQLKRKEQECEELKKNVEHWKMEHKEAKAKGEWTYDLVKKRLEQQLDKLKAENEKLEQTLAEIKEISKEEIKNVSEEFIRRTPMFGIHKQILQKISECEGNNEN